MLKKHSICGRVVYMETELKETKPYTVTVGDLTVTYEDGVQTFYLKNQEVFSQNVVLCGDVLPPMIEDTDWIE
jgi:hypothetical protein